MAEDVIGTGAEQRPQIMKKFHVLGGSLQPSSQQDAAQLDNSLPSTSLHQDDKLSVKSLSTAAKKRVSSPRRPVAEPDGKLRGAVTVPGTLQSHEHEELENSSDQHQNGGGQAGSVASDNTDDNLDVVDAAGADSSYDSTRYRDLIARLNQKITKVSNMIKTEHTAKEENVNEYLRLSSATDKPAQAQRIKLVFEKRNRQSSNTIAQLQKKLESYQKRLEQVEHQGLPRKQNVLKDVGQGLKELFSPDGSLKTAHLSPSATRDVGSNIRDGISGLSGGMVDNIRGAKESIAAKPKEFASLLKNRFGSTDNILSQKSGEEGFTEEELSHIGSPGRLRSPDDVGEMDDVHSMTSSDSSPLNIVLPPSPHPSHDLNEMQHQLQEMQHHQIQVIAQIEHTKQHLEDLQQSLRQALDEERFRCERLEEQINDLTELHQHEVTNLKQELQSMEEKMEYQLMERTRDMQELLESCQTRITKMELQQQQQQIISMETFENSGVRNLLTKVINVVLALLAVILVLASTIVNLVGPFLGTRLRILSTVVLLIITVILWKHWDEVELFVHHTISNYRGK